MKQSLYFGDVHLSALNPYNTEAGENFLKWFEEYDFGVKEDLEAFFAGDITERDVNPGTVIAQLVRMLQICHEKFARTYIVLGNHDKKLYKGAVQHSLMFVEDTWDNIFIIEDLQEIKTPNGFKVLCMPHRYNEDFCKRYNEYIADHADDFYNAVVGHFYISESYGGDFVDISKLKNIQLHAIGHVHTRISKSYLGSLWPNSASEDYTPLPRAVQVLSEDGKNTEILLPAFLRFIKVDYPLPLPSEECTTVYIINNASLEDAKEKYPNVKYIKVGKPKVEEVSVTSMDNQSVDNSKKNSEYFNDMINDLNLKISRASYRTIMNILSN